MLKEGFADEIHINTQVSLSFWDRIKVLFGKTLHVQTRTQVENLPGRLETTSRCYVERLIPTKPVVTAAMERDK